MFYSSESAPLSAFWCGIGFTLKLVYHFPFSYQINFMHCPIPSQRAESCTLSLFLKKCAFFITCLTMMFINIHWQWIFLEMNKVNTLHRSLFEILRMRTTTMFLFSAFQTNSDAKCWLCWVPTKIQYQWNVLLHTSPFVYEALFRVLLGAGPTGRAVAAEFATVAFEVIVTAMLYAFSLDIIIVTCPRFTPLCILQVTHAITTRVRTYKTSLKSSVRIPTNPSKF